MRASVTVEGTENLPPHGEAVMFVPNHSSFLDIFALSGFLPRRFKYISKIEILRIPLIGWAMKFAKHIAIRRTDRASQLATFKEAVECLQAGSSLVTFAEGTRSKDGRLMPFKKGPFTMASRAKVRIVPISVIGTHIYFPASSIAPSTSPRGLRIVVHPPIEAPQDKKGEVAALEACEAAIASVLPPEMLPIPKDA
uniref:Phospholipid/glycerol acyltransferase domain-containing protein n=1 Tax=Haptolina ericina TaxID=156174 RepID=A0A7S3ETA0_9EUKA